MCSEALLKQVRSYQENANKLVQSTNWNIRLLLEKVEALEKIVKRGDTAVAAAKAIHVSVLGLVLLFWDSWLFGSSGSVHFRRIKLVLMDICSFSYMHACVV